MGLTIGLFSCRSPFLDNDRVYPPLASLYLSTAIKKAHPDAKVVITDDYQDLSVVDDLDLLGVSIMTPQREEASKLLRAVKERRPDLPVVAGGPHVKHYLDDLLGSGFDHLVTHDGIRAINKIIEGNAPRVVRDIIPVREYAREWVKPDRLNNADFLRSFGYELAGREATTIMTAQGCPEACAFCEDAGTVVRQTPLHLLREELDDIVSLGYGGVYVFDDLFAMNQRIARPIAEEFGSRGLVYRCNGHARRFDADFAALLAATGCVEVAFGAESGSQKILDNINKRTTVEQNYRFVATAQRAGIKVKAFLMLGLPGETHETVRETEAFLRDSGVDSFQLAIYYPYKGTAIRDGIDAGAVTDCVFTGEGLGAYGQRDGRSECVISTGGLSRSDLLAAREDLIFNYGGRR